MTKWSNAPESKRACNASTSSAEPSGRTETMPPKPCSDGITALHQSGNCSAAGAEWLAGKAASSRWVTKADTDLAMVPVPGITSALWHLPTLKLRHKMALSNEIPSPTKPLMAGCQQEHCCASLSDLLPPAEIVDAAENVRVWMEINGYRNWQLGGVCDRRFADECKRLKSACDRWSESETLHPLMHCQTCGELRGMDHACDSLHNVHVDASPPLTPQDDAQR